ncbi:transcriptional regulator with XRE-family HTH domain [Catenuloplanes nepalensis]|uniref:Transcriptional regulator with XRE-family HTH domain n=1 Tax=Catenuloplanes nepalensis TaxID=587533 RepID=A0ABT9MLT7_9ACTN|nr:helix-turn-helix transcriptional regulator [Catenuloplanes nepalensis]MDP9792380.1 transcriptional regulator with XRE-family HTH domain [Catenuloplanes nepalensis]
MTIAPHSRTARLAELGDFLRRRRDALSPREAGLPGGGRRRAPGLRRDEVAALAHLSVTYYERLEQGRGPHPSAATLSALAGALRLAGERREHLFRLAGQAAPGSPEQDETPDPGLLSLLHANALTPGYLSDDLGTIIAQNPLNIALFGTFTGLPGWAGNLVWRWFTSPAWRDLLEPGKDHSETARAYVTDLRMVVAQRGHDETAVALVHDLRAASAEFARMWDEHDVSALHCSDKHIGGLHLECVVVTSPHSRQRLLLLHPIAGTGTEARLAALQLG